MPPTPSDSHSSRSKSRSAAPPERRLSLLLLLVAAHQRMTQVVERELAADGVESNGYAVLSLIGVRGAMRLTELAAELGMPLTTASDVVRRLEGREPRAAAPEPRGRQVVSLRADGPRRPRVAPRLGSAAADQRGPRDRVDEAEMRAALTTLGSAFEQALTDG